jgi:hypothetical protein
MKTNQLNFKFILILLTVLVFSIKDVSAQNNNDHKLLGKVFVDGENAKGVEVKFFDDNNSFVEYKTKSNGKVVFNGDCGKKYTVQFKKEGYITKRIAVNTIDENKVLKNHGFDFVVSLEKSEYFSDQISNNSTDPHFEF